MAERQHQIFLKHLECPVCLDTYTDPRDLPCPHGTHTLCRSCLPGLVHGSSLVCPICKAKHAIPQLGTDGFPRSLILTGMVDSLCKQCRTAHPEVKCSHCNQMLCQACKKAHISFDGAQKSLRRLHVSISKADSDANDTDIRYLERAVEKEIDNAIDLLAQQLEHRRWKLKADLQRFIKFNLRTRNIWRPNVKMETSAAQRYLDATNDQLGDVFNAHVTVQEMSNIISESNARIQKVEKVLKHIPSTPKPVFKYNIQAMISAIRSFGCFDVLSPDTKDCPIAVNTTGPLTAGRPRVVGEEGSCSGQFMHPTGVAVCLVSGHVVVADPGNKRVQIFDEELSHIMNISECGTEREFHDPLAVAVNHTGEILVSDCKANQVLLYGQAGNYVRRLPGDWNGPLGVAVDDEDNIYVCDRGSYTVKVLNKHGHLTRTIGGRGPSPGEFSNWPRSIAINRDYILVAATNGQVHHFTTSGDVSKQTHLASEGRTTGMTATLAGDLVVLDRDGPISVTRRDQTLCLVGEEGKEPWQLNNPYGVALTRNGQIVVANCASHNVLVYDLVQKSYMD